MPLRVYGHAMMNYAEVQRLAAVTTMTVAPLASFDEQMAGIGSRSFALAGNVRAFEYEIRRRYLNRRVGLCCCCCC